MIAFYESVNFRPISALDAFLDSNLSKKAKLWDAREGLMNRVKIYLEAKKIFRNYQPKFFYVPNEKDDLGSIVIFGISKQPGFNVSVNLSVLWYLIKEDEKSGRYLVLYKQAFLPYPFHTEEEKRKTLKGFEKISKYLKTCRTEKDMDIAIRKIDDGEIAPFSGTI